MRGYTCIKGGRDAQPVQLLCLNARTQKRVWPALHGCTHMYLHNDTWLEPCRADGIVVTSAGAARSQAIGSAITWKGTWLLVLS